MNKFVAGAVSGFAATAPMTAAMVVMHRLLPWTQRYPLPPRKITMNVAEAAGVKHDLSESQRKAATLAAHFGYGSAMGGLFALVSQRFPGPPVARGVTWGLLVWAGSYLGLLPAVDLHEPATRQPRERNLLMIVAHIVWGAALGLLLKPARSVRLTPPKVLPHPPSSAARAPASPARARSRPRSARAASPGSASKG